MVDFFQSHRLWPNPPLAFTLLNIDTITDLPVAWRPALREQRVGASSRPVRSHQHHGLTTYLMPLENGHPFPSKHGRRSSLEVALACRLIQMPRRDT